MNEFSLMKWNIWLRFEIENEPDKRKYGVGGWRFEQLQGEREELDDSKDGDECDENGQPLNILIIYDNDSDNILTMLLNI